MTSRRRGRRKSDGWTLSFSVDEPRITPQPSIPAYCPWEPPSPCFLFFFLSSLSENNPISRQPRHLDTRSERKKRAPIFLLIPSSGIPPHRHTDTPARPFFLDRPCVFKIPDHNTHTHTFIVGEGALPRARARQLESPCSMDCKSGATSPCTSSFVSQEEALPAVVFSPAEQDALQWVLEMKEREPTKVCVRVQVCASVRVRVRMHHVHVHKLVCMCACV